MKKLTLILSLIVVFITTSCFLLNTSLPSDLEEYKNEKGTIIVIDYRLPSYQNRLWVLKDGNVIFTSRVSHGKNSGSTYATEFSNEPSSNKTCIGKFKTGNVYYGKHGLSLNVYGLEKGINDNAYKRRIVFHGADYSTKEFLFKHGRLGRSFGCFATSPEDNSKIIELIKGGKMVYVKG